MAFVNKHEKFFLAALSKKVRAGDLYSQSPCGRDKADNYHNISFFLVLNIGNPSGKR